MIYSRRLKWKNLVLFILLAVLAGLTSYTSSQTSLSAQITSPPRAVSDIDTRAAGLRVALNSLNKQHVDLAAEAMRDGYDGFGSDEFKASTRALDNNSVATADMMEAIYGVEVGDKFLEAWRKRIDAYMNFTLAVKGNDRSGMERAMSDLDNQAEQLSDILSSANQSLQKDIVKQMIIEHAQMMLGVIGARAAGDWQASYDIQDIAYNQIGQLADGLAAAIVHQFPERFQ